MSCVVPDKLPVDIRRVVNKNTFTYNLLKRGKDKDDSDLQVVTCMARNVHNGREIGVGYKDGYINVISTYTISVRFFCQTPSQQIPIAGCPL